MDLRDTAILKGLAISVIVFHNYFHLVSPAHENEFNFNPSRFGVFLRTVVHPALAIQAIFSFFGHFGVQVFVFLSAYGLARSHWDDCSDWGAFMAGRVRKLFPIIGLVVLPWIVAVSFQEGFLVFLKKMGLEFVLMFAGLSSVVPGYSQPPVTTWWFIPFIVQLYAIFPLVRRLMARFGWPALLLLSILSITVTFIANPILARWSLNLLETPIARLPVICLGIVAARSSSLRLNGPIALVSGATLILGSRFTAFWLLTFPAALLLTLWIYGSVRGTLRRIGLLERIGHYSLIIFLVNALVRNQFVTLPEAERSPLLFGCMSALVSFLLAGVIQELIVRRLRSAPNYASLDQPLTGQGQLAERA